MLGVEQVKKLLPISTSNNTIQRRISSLSTDINSQVVEEQEISMGFHIADAWCFWLCYLCDISL